MSSIFTDIFNPHASNRQIFGVPIPDFGISEFVSRNIGAPIVASGGSNLFGPAQPTQNYTYTSGNTGGQVAGTNTTAGGSGNTGYRVTNPNPTNNNNNAPSCPSQNENDQINQAYQPTMDYLNQLSNEYSLTGQPYQSAETALKDNYGALVPAVENRAKEQNTALDTQGQQVTNREQNALAQARQLYNELSQSNLARFGTGSSAGGASNEILGRATSQQFGTIGQTAEAGVQAITQERQKVADFVQEKKTQFDAAQKDAINNLQNSFRDKLNQIGLMKAQTEQAKTQARLDLLGQYRQQAFNLQAARQTADLQLETWLKQKQAGLDQVAAFSTNPNIGTNTGSALDTGAQAFNASVPRVGSAVAMAAPPAPTGAITASPNQYGLDPQKLREQLAAQGLA